MDSASSTKPTAAAEVLRLHAPIASRRQTKRPDKLARPLNPDVQKLVDAIALDMARADHARDTSGSGGGATQ